MFEQVQQRLRAVLVASEVVEKLAEADHGLWRHPQHAARNAAFPRLGVASLASTTDYSSRIGGGRLPKRIGGNSLTGWIGGNTRLARQIGGNSFTGWIGGSLLPLRGLHVELHVTRRDDGDDHDTLHGVEDGTEVRAALANHPLHPLGAAHAAHARQVVERDGRGVEAGIVAAAAGGVCALQKKTEATALVVALEEPRQDEEDVVGDLRAALHLSRKIAQICA